MHAVNDWIRSAAEREAGIRWVDTRRAAAAPDNIDRLGSSPDDLHPDIDGYRRMAESLMVALVP
jgi:lysophospholipase L1-like esterase